MKRIITLLVLAITVFAFRSAANPPSCNPAFDAQFINASTVKFVPAVANDSPLVQHYWYFDDGSPGSYSISPVHTFAPGTYTIRHYLFRYDANQNYICGDSLFKTITIQQSQNCNLQPNFTWTVATNNPLEYHFTNTTVNLLPTDSIFWTFGDGAFSNVVSPAHTYAQPGTYNVCLRIKRANGNTTAPCIREICKTVIIQGQPCNMQANFTWTVAQNNPMEFHFTNTTVNLLPTDSIKWNFGDGSLSSVVNPTHIYTQPGTYTVCLVIRRFNTGSTTPCVSEVCKTISIQQPCNLQPNFTWTVAQNNPLEFHFTNTTVNLLPTDSVRWTFGDGISSTAMNPTHVYAQPGTYNVCLIIKRNNANTTAPCVREICKIITIQGVPCNIQPNFSWTVASGNPREFHFTNTTVNLLATDSSYWTFGDGTSSILTNPTHIYAQPGTYNVCLIIKRANSNTTAPCVREICKTITIQQPCNLQAAFSWQRDSLNYKKIYFTNQSSLPTPNAIAVWTFGDGTSATSWHAVHEYAQPGRYYVCLKIQYNNTCFSTTCDTVTVQAPPPPCNQLSSFRFEKSPNDNQLYRFTPDYLSNDVQYTWTFGDGTGSHDAIATHRFATAGTYTVCLTVYRNNNCASTTCKQVTVTQQFNCDSIHVSYTQQFDPFIPNKVYFYAIGNFPILDQTWTITRVNNTSIPPVILHQNNPAYIFQDTGSYRVCLRAVTLGGCIKEYCSIVRITQLANGCLLQAYPNPAHNEVKVNVMLNVAQPIHVYVYNSLNVLVMEKHVPGVTGNNIVSLIVSNLLPGAYNMKVVYGNSICFARFNKF